MAPILPPLTMAFFCSFCFIVQLFACNPHSIILKAGTHALLVEATIHRNKNDVDLLVIPGNDYAESGDVQRAAVLMALSGLQCDDKVFDLRPVERLCFNNNPLLRTETKPWRDSVMRSSSRMILPTTRTPEYEWPEFYLNEKVTLISYGDFGVHHGLASLYNEAVRHIFAANPSFNINDVAKAMEQISETRELPKPIITIRMPPSLSAIRVQNTVLNEKLFKQRIAEHRIDDALWEQVKFYLDDDPYLGRNAALSQRDFISAAAYKLRTKIGWGQFNELWGIEGLTIRQRWSRLMRNKKIKFNKLERLLVRANEKSSLEDDSSMDYYGDCSKDSESLEESA